ncbi:MAG: OmpA family protein [Rubrivivax sp.]|nr:OmpA family protein [Rubrivivax sp.]MDP3613078.1 OmpA family protein [Rubrivivax sp.]
MNTRLKTSPAKTGPLRIAAVALAVGALVLSGCESMSEREKGTGTGAAVGAVGGAILGSGGGNAGRGAVIGGAIGAVAGNLWSKRLEDKRKAVERASAGTGVEVVRTNDDRLKLNVPSDVSFDTGSAAIRPAMRPVLDEVSRNIDDGLRLQIIGHTDSTGNDTINEPLSLDRARSVRDYLVARGVPSQRISVAGQGSREPVASNTNDQGRAQNRRVEIFLSDSAG